MVSALQVERGVAYLCEVLKEVNEQRQSKSWYLLRAQALQACSAYLSLDTTDLPDSLRHHIAQHGRSSASTHKGICVKTNACYALICCHLFLYFRFQKPRHCIVRRSKASRQPAGHLGGKRPVYDRQRQLGHALR